MLGKKAISGHHEGVGALGGDLLVKGWGPP